MHATILLYKWLDRLKVRQRIANPQMAVQLRLEPYSFPLQGKNPFFCKNDGYPNQSLKATKPFLCTKAL